MPAAMLATPGPLRQPFTERNYTISGITRDQSGNALGNCTLDLVNVATNIVEQTGISDASGNYSFVVDKTKLWQVIAYKAGAPDVTGATTNIAGV